MSIWVNYYLASGWVLNINPQDSQLCWLPQTRQNVNVINRSIWRTLQNFDRGFSRVISYCNLASESVEKIVENEPHAGRWWNLTKGGEGVHGSASLKISDEWGGGSRPPVTLPLKISEGGGGPHHWFPALDPRMNSIVCSFEIILKLCYQRQKSIPRSFMWKISKKSKRGGGGPSDPLVLTRHYIFFTI
jgi:hypothetical protein